MTLGEAYNPRYVHWFGAPWPRPDWRAPICEDDRYRIPTPVGETCLLCHEPIEEGDRGVRYASGVVFSPADQSGRWAAFPAPAPYAHAECNLRSVTGNHLHAAGMCTHLGECNELSNLSYREEAQLVWQMQVSEAG